MRYQSTFSRIRQEVQTQHQLDRIQKRFLLDVLAVNATSMRRKEGPFVAGSGSCGGTLQQGLQQQ
jgi:hypothetical protein